MPQNRNQDINTRHFSALDKSIHDLWDETNKRKTIDIGICIANEVMKIFIPNNARWQENLVTGEDALDKAIPASKLPNQKSETWFVQHPYLGGERIMLEHFSHKDAPFESYFYALNKSSTKARISAAVHLTKNWEHSTLTQNTKYKVGINFFLSGDSKRVFIVLSNQGNLRVMELNDHLTNTQKEIFNKLYGVCELKTGIMADSGTSFDSTQKIIHTALWDAFALHELNNKFYAGVASHFEMLLQHLTGKKGGSKDPEDSKLFVSRLLGRLLFIWFLRKKNIVSESKHYFDTVDNLDGSDYYEKHLKNLFFETLNTPIKDRKSNDNETPYLNGGLFEYHKNDWADEKVSFPPDWFQTLYNHFNEFNFTTDESSPDYEQVAIDPEMLGRVFESLLASQITSTGEQARKAKGAFYTPREIVAYMCKESLRQYLYTGLNNTALNGGVDSLLDKNDAEFETAHTNAKRDLWGLENSEKISRDVISMLDKIKILDPACGSGAFPMGMVQLLEKVYERLEPRFDRYKTKLTVIQNNIYGVDIEPMAVEIARLRAWLSIIVDEEDPHNIKPLPNLDFKFVCANSLIALEKENELFDDVTVIDRLLQIIQEYMNIHDPAAKDKKIQEYMDTVKQLPHGAMDKPQYVTKKTQQMMAWNPKQDTPSNFFDPAIMFAKQAGFDIIIGNPPYIQLQNNGGLLANKYQNSGYTTFVRSGDIYQLFYERGFELLNKKGHLCLITSNKWLRAGYGETTRKYIASKMRPLQLIDFAGQRVFETATVDVCIILIEKTAADNQHQTDACIVKEDCLGNLTDYVRQHGTLLEFTSGDSWVILSPIERRIKEKIEKVGKPLKEWDISINYGIKTGCNKAFIIDKNKRDELIAKDAKSAEIIRPILRGRDIERYKINFADQYLINTHNGNPVEKVPPIDVEKYPAIKEHLDKYLEKIMTREDQGNTPYNLRSCAYMNDFSKQKIVWGNLNLKAAFTLAPKNIFVNAPSTMIIPGDKFILGVLNSKLADYFIRNLGVTRNGGYFEYKPMFVSQMPIPNPIQKDKEDIELLVTEIIKAKEKNIDTLDIDFELNRKIYKLFFLTKEEIDHLEKDNLEILSR